MDFAVKYSRRAQKDLREIVAYISRFDPRAAARVGEQLIEHAESLSNFPKRGTLWKKSNDVWKMLSAPYQIFYRIVPETRSVQILRFWHSARDERKIRWS